MVAYSLGFIACAPIGSKHGLHVHLNYLYWAGPSKPLTISANSVSLAYPNSLNLLDLGVLRTKVRIIVLTVSQYPEVAISSRQ